MKGYFKLIAFVAATLLPASLKAAPPALKLSPLLYQQVIGDDKPKIGYIDVSNPADTAVVIQTQVRAFRQLNLSGDLEYYDDSRLSSGIQIGSNSFELGAREARRVAFTVEPKKLPKGGIYATLFFQTVPPLETAKSSYISESAKVGTLLIITNGKGSTSGTILPRLNLLQIGAGIRGDIEYKNTGVTPSGIAYNPQLSVKLQPFGRGVSVNGPLIFPGNTRSFTFSRTGSYLGIFPITYTDTLTHQNVRRWVIACTGWWRYGFPLLLIVIAALIVRKRRLNAQPSVTPLKSPHAALDRTPSPAPTVTEPAIQPAPESRPSEQTIPVAVMKPSKPKKRHIDVSVED